MTRDTMLGDMREFYYEIEQLFDRIEELRREVKRANSTANGVENTKLKAKNASLTASNKALRHENGKLATLLHGAQEDARIYKEELDGLRTPPPTDRSLRGISKPPE